MKEYKVGQIVTINGTKCRVVKSDNTCKGCIFCFTGCLGHKCYSSERKDGRSVKFEPISEINKNKKKEEMYKVKQSDLVGDVNGFPIEVVQKMVDEQERQGNKPDVTIFQINKSTNKDAGGFHWCETEGGVPFWAEVIEYKCFNMFFKRYPKSGHPKLENAEFPLPPEKMRVWIRGNKERGEEVIKALTDLGGENKNKETGRADYCVYFIDLHKNRNIITSTYVGLATSSLVANLYKEIKLPWKPKDKELVWAWDNDHVFIKTLGFYNSVNNCLFSCYNGNRTIGFYYDNYAPYECEWPDWAKEAQKKLED